jgi:hypothetical protein
VRLLRVILATLLLAGCGTSASQSSNTTEQKITTTTAVPTLLSCFTYQASTVAGTVKDAELDELSGLVKSSRNAGIFWTHNDSGDTARIFAIKPTGERVATITLNNADAFDYEDIAVSSEDKEIWVADIGDNFHFRPDVQLYHFPEPDTSKGDVAVEARRLTVRYENPSGKGKVSPDAEAFFIDHSGNGYIVEKTNNEKSTWVFQISAEDMNKSSATAKPIVQITGNSNGNGYGPTAADLSSDGTTLVIKNYSETFAWRFTATSSIPAVLAKQPTALCTIKAGLGEAIAFDGNDLLTVEEGVGRPIKRTKRTTNR